jgi:antitoxin (DNA-binding transcriptional repressor) of toxin-antitoxin stability system
MNRHVNMLEAKTQLSRLVEAIESGAEEEIVIARNGKPAARLVPLERKPKRKGRLGLLEGKYPVLTQEEFDIDNEEIWREWNEKSLFPENSEE